MLLDDVGTWLQNAGLSLTVGGNLFRGELPPSPARAVGLFEPGGPPPRASFSGIEYEAPHVQFLVRDDDYDAARELAEHVYQLVAGFHAGSIAGYLAAQPLGSPAFAYREENEAGSAVFSVNAEFWKPLSAI